MSFLKLPVKGDIFNHYHQKIMEREFELLHKNKLEFPSKYLDVLDLMYHT